MDSTKYIGMDVHKEATTIAVMNPAGKLVMESIVELDKGVTALGVRVVRTPVRAPQANAICERFGGTLRRECLDFLIPLNERHLKPHMSLGPGIPVPLPHSPPASGSRHLIPAGHVVRSTAILGGLHHEYALEKTAA